jgi:hypothetical protein
LHVRYKQHQSTYWLISPLIPDCCPSIDGGRPASGFKK